MLTDTRFAAIRALDLDPIKVKLMHRQSGEGWDLAYTDAVANEYRRFLMLIKAHPQEVSSPHFAVDTFWHYHILDTLKYADDCEMVFGYFLHHYPYVGLQGDADADAAAHERLGARHRELYLATFADASGLDLLERGPHADTAAWAAGVASTPRQAYSSNMWPAAAAGVASTPAYSSNMLPPSSDSAAFAPPLDATGLRAYAAGMTTGPAGLTLDGVSMAPQWQASEELRRMFAERPRLKRHD